MKTALYELCYNAHRNISFRPEDRARMYVTYYHNWLKEDLEKIEGDENKEKYKEKYRTLFFNWMNAKSRCISSMITGPARFPTGRAMKANESERKHQEKFEEFRKKWRNGPPKPRATAEEQAETLPQRLEKLEALREKVKEQNKIDKKNLGKGRYENGKWTHTYPPYILTNLGAKIRNTKKKIKEMEARIENKKGWEDITFEGGYVTCGDDRLRVMFDEKPTREVIQLCKRHGMRWSPKNKARQRQFTSNALNATNKLLLEINNI